MCCKPRGISLRNVIRSSGFLKCSAFISAFAKEMCGGLSSAFKFFEAETASQRRKSTGFVAWLRHFPIVRPWVRVRLCLSFVSSLAKWA